MLLWVAYPYRCCQLPGNIDVLNVHPDKTLINAFIMKKEQTSRINVDIFLKRLVNFVLNIFAVRAKFPNPEFGCLPVTNALKRDTPC